MPDAAEHEYLEYIGARLPALHRLAYALCGDVDQADDLVQEAVTRLFQRWSRVVRADNVDAYVRAVVVRLFLDGRRKGWWRVALFAAPPDTRSAEDRTADERTVLLAALRQVPPRQRAVLVLRFLHDLPVEEVARTLGCSTGTVKSQTAHGLAAMPAPRRAGAHRDDGSDAMTLDEDRIAVLLREAEVDPPRGARVDLGRAVRDGRRRRRNRRGAVAGTAALATLAAAGVLPVLLDSRREAPPPAVTPPTTCEVSTLPLPAGADGARVTGGDSTGRYLVGTATGPSHRQVEVVWDGDRVTELPAPFEGTDVNSSGTVVGFVEEDGLYVYRDGRLERLPGKSVMPQLVNDAGVVVGEGYASRGNESVTVPVRWRSLTSQPEYLPLPGPGWSGEVTGLDEDGTMVGTVSDGFAPSTYRGYRWRPDGTGEFLPVPVTPEGPADAFWPVSVRNGLVVGTMRRAVPGSMEIAIMRLDLRTGEFVSLPAPAQTYAGLSNGRWTVGMLDNRVGAVRMGLISEAGVLELPEPADVPERLNPRVAVISDDGRTIAGTLSQRHTEDRVELPVRWRCR